MVAVMALLPLLVVSTHGIRIAAKNVASRTAVPSRRNLLGAALFFAPAATLCPPAVAAQALEILDDLSAPEASQSLPAPVESGFLAAVAVDPTVKKSKSKINGAYSRIKELQSQGSLTDKEKKELKRLKAEEMCEMLGKGC